MTTPAIIVSLAIGAALGLIGPVLARRLPPREATWIISVGAVMVAFTGGVVLVLIGASLLGQLCDLLGLGHWSGTTLRDHAPTEPGVGALALLAATLSAGALALVASHRGRELWHAYRACDGVPDGSRLVVVEDPGAGAVAIPGRPGHVVVSRGLLASLSPFERRVLLAHERAHLAAGHHWHRSVVAVAAAANPLLRPLVSSVNYTTERWADEIAASEVGDRPGVARAVARVALLTGHRAASSPPVLAIDGRPVTARVSALLEDAPRQRPILTAGAICLLVLGLLAALMVEKDVEHLFELAGHTYLVGSNHSGR